MRAIQMLDVRAPSRKFGVLFRPHRNAKQMLSAVRKRRKSLEMDGTLFRDPCKETADAETLMYPASIDGDGGWLAAEIFFVNTRAVHDVIDAIAHESNHAATYICHYRQLSGEIRKGEKYLDEAIAHMAGALASIGVQYYVVARGTPASSRRNPVIPGLCSEWSWKPEKARRKVTKT